MALYKCYLLVHVCSGGAREHPDEGAAFPTGGLRPRAAAAPPSGYGAETSGFIAFRQLRIASPAEFVTGSEMKFILNIEGTS